MTLERERCANKNLDLLLMELERGDLSVESSDHPTTTSTFIHHLTVEHSMRTKLSTQLETLNKQLSHLSQFNLGSITEKGVKKSAPLFPQ